MDRLIVFFQVVVLWAIGCILLGVVLKITWRVASIGWYLLP